MCFFFRWWAASDCFEIGTAESGESFRLHTATRRRRVGHEIWQLFGRWRPVLVSSRLQHGRLQFIRQGAPVFGSQRFQWHSSRSQHQVGKKKLVWKWFWWMFWLTFDRVVVLGCIPMSRHSILSPRLPGGSRPTYSAINNLRIVYLSRKIERNR